MKKVITCIVTVLLLLTFNPTQSVAEGVIRPSTLKTNTTDAEKVNVMVKRLNEIDVMDKSNLSSSEKRALRKEVRSIKKEIERTGGGVYLSVGALLLIIILLIILL